MSFSIELGGGMTYNSEAGVGMDVEIGGMKYNTATGSFRSEVGDTGLTFDTKLGMGFEVGGVTNYVDSFERTSGGAAPECEEAVPLKKTVKKQRSTGILAQAHFVKDILKTKFEFSN